MERVPVRVRVPERLFNAVVSSGISPSQIIVSELSEVSPSLVKHISEHVKTLISRGGRGRKVMRDIAVYLPPDVVKKIDSVIEQIQREQNVFLTRSDVIRALFTAYLIRSLYEINTPSPLSLSSTQDR